MDAHHRRFPFANAVLSAPCFGRPEPAWRIINAAIRAPRTGDGETMTTWWWGALGAPPRAMGCARPLLPSMIGEGMLAKSVLRNFGAPTLWWRDV